MRFEPCWLGALNIPRRLNALELGAVKSLPQNASPNSTSASTLPQFSLLMLLVAFFSTSLSGSLLSWNCWCWTNGEDGSTHHVWDCPLSICLRIVFDVDILDFNLGIQVDSVKQPTKRNSMGSRHLSHCWTSAFDDHFNHCFVILKNVKHSTRLRRLHVWRNIISVAQFKIFVLIWGLNLVLGVSSWWCAMQPNFHAPSLWVSSNWFREECNTSKTKSKRSRPGFPSMCRPASREIFSSSVELCETEVCFWHTQLLGTNVWRPKIHKFHPEIDFESWNGPNLHCCAVFPTWQYCFKSLVWCI